MAKSSEAIPGAVFHDLTVLAQHRMKHQTFALCACICGSIKDIPTNWLGRGTKSCGCSRAKSLGKLSNKAKLGLDSPEKLRTFEAWRNMLERTSPTAVSRHERYRKLAPADSWRSFENFVNHMGFRPAGLTLERIDTRLPYSAANCKWGTRAEQVRNREYTRFFVKAGRVLMMSELANEFNISKAGMRYRANNEANLDGWVEIPYAEFLKLTTRAET